MVCGAMRSGFFLVVARGYRLFVGIDEVGIEAPVEQALDELGFTGTVPRARINPPPWT